MDVRFTAKVLDFGTLQQGDFRRKFFRIELVEDEIAGVPFTVNGPDFVNVEVTPTPKSIFPLRIRCSVDASKMATGKYEGEIELVAGTERFAIKAKLVVVGAQLAVPTTIVTASPKPRANELPPGTVDVPEEVPNAATPGVLLSTKVLMWIASWILAVIPTIVLVLVVSDRHDGWLLDSIGFSFVTATILWIAWNAGVRQGYLQESNVTVLLNQTLPKWSARKLVMVVVGLVVVLFLVNQTVRSMRYNWRIESLCEVVEVAVDGKTATFRDTGRWAGGEIMISFMVNGQAQSLDNIRDRRIFQSDSPIKTIELVAVQHLSGPFVLGEASRMCNKQLYP